MIKIKIIFIIILLLLFVQQCTTVNIIPTLVAKKEFKYLSEGVSSKNFSIDKIGDMRSITYDSIHSYFIVNVYKRVNDKTSNTTGHDIIKIDTDGNTLYTINDGILAYKSHYAFTDSVVYDVSKEKLEKTPFKKIINTKEELKKEEWYKVFNAYYKNANTILYGESSGSEYNYRYPIYFKHNNDWTLLYANAYLPIENVHNETIFDGYPSRYRKLMYLKDENSSTYSDSFSHSNSSIDIAYKNLDLLEIDYPENELKYIHEKIEKITFEKQSIAGKYTYTPFVSRFLGTGYYKLKKRNEYIKFKENAFKNPFALFQSDSYLNHYTISEQFKDKTDVSFIRYSFHTNQNESKSQGLYLIKKKHK